MIDEGEIQSSPWVTALIILMDGSQEAEQELTCQGVQTVRPVGPGLQWTAPLSSTSLFQFVIFFIFVFKFWGSFIFICLCEVKDVKTRSQSPINTDVLMFSHQENEEENQ